MFQGLSDLGSAYLSFMSPATLAYGLGGAFVGIVMGILPGLAATLAIALLTTLTIKLQANDAILVLICSSVSALYGGSRTAILLHIPDTAANAASCADGYALALKGQAGRAIGIAISGAFASTLFGVICLALRGRRDPRLRDADGGDQNARWQAHPHGQPGPGACGARPGRLRTRVQPPAQPGARAGGAALVGADVRSGPGRLLGQHGYRGGDGHGVRMYTGDAARFQAILASTVPLSRHIFRSPTRFCKTGAVFMAWLNGHQDHFVMVGGQQSTRSILHLAELFRLADAAGLLQQPEPAAARMRTLLALQVVV